jgi:hypothetical protein
LKGSPARANSHAAGTGIIGITAIANGAHQNDYTVSIVDLGEGQAGNETIAWTSDSVTIAVEVGVSTVAQALAGTVTGTPWATLTEEAAGTLYALAPTAMNALPNYVAGVNDTFNLVFRKPKDAAGFDGSIVESYDNVAITSVGYPTGAVLLTDAVNGVSQYFEVTIDDSSLIPVTGIDNVFILGNDGESDVKASDFIGTVSGITRTGMKLLYDVDTVDFNLLACPGMVDESVINEMRLLCESRGDAFAVTEVPVDKNNTSIPMNPYVIGKEGKPAYAQLFDSDTTEGKEDTLGLTLLVGGSDTGSKTVLIKSGATAGQETVEWKNNELIITIAAASTTVARILQAAETPIGTPWGILSNLSATPWSTTLNTLDDGSGNPVAISSLDDYTAGANYALFTPADLADWHNAVDGMDYDETYRPWGLSSALNSSVVSGPYCYWVKYKNPYDDKYYWTSPAGNACQTYAYSDKVRYPWFAPAGLNRGILREGLDSQYSPTQNERNLMQSGPNGSNCLNPIVNFTNIGSAFWGQKTSQRMASAMDRVNVVRMVLYARKIIATASKYVVFDPNDTKTWSQLRGICNPVLRDIASKRGLYEFKVVIDETTNTPDIIDQNRLYGKIYLKPTKTAEVIELDFIITSTGANFEEI